MPGAFSSLLFLVVRPGAPGSILARSSDPSSFLFLVVRPGASILASSSDARSL